jgi:hypothetical protein
MLVMAFDYDPMDQAPDSFEGLSTYEGAVQCQAWKPATLTWKGANRPLEQSYIASLGATEDRFMDAGQFLTGYLGQSTGVLGRFYINYSITLMRPQLLMTAPGFAAGIPNQDQLASCPSATSVGRYVASNEYSVLGTVQDVLTDGLKFDLPTGVISLPASVRKAELQFFTDFITNNAAQFPAKTDPSTVFKVEPVYNTGGTPVFTKTDVGVLANAPYSTGGNEFAGAFRGLLEVPESSPDSTLMFRLMIPSALAAVITNLRPFVSLVRASQAFSPFDSQTLEIPQEDVSCTLPCGYPPFHDRFGPRTPSRP